MTAGDAAAGAFVDHAVQLALEFAPQQDAPADLFAVAMSSQERSRSEARAMSSRIGSTEKPNSLAW